MKRLCDQLHLHVMGRREEVVRRVLAFGARMDELVFVRSMIPDSWKPTDIVLAPTSEVLEVAGRAVWEMTTVYGEHTIEIRERWLDAAFAGDGPGPVVLA